MGYKFSSNVKTLTHWQSGTGSGTESGPYTSKDKTWSISGIVHNGLRYFMPFVVWDLDSKEVNKNFYFDLNLEPKDPIASGYYNGSGPTEISAVYTLYEKKPIYHKAYENSANATITYNMYIGDKTEPSDLIKQTFEAGKTYNLIVPKFSCYLLVTAYCPKGSESDIPDFLQGFKKLSERTAPPKLIPSKFTGIVEFESGDQFISAPKGSDVYSHYLQKYDSNGYYSGGWYGLKPYSVGSSSNTSRPSSIGGSQVSGSLGIIPQLYTFTKKYGNCQVNYYITHELTGYYLTSGVLFNIKEE